MNYTITTVQNGETYDVEVKIMDGETEVLTGRTSVCCSAVEEARNYAETVFLPDLKVNFKALKDLQLPEVVLDDTEPIIEG